MSPGETVKTSARGHTLVYPFDVSNLKTGHGDERTHQETLKFAAAATEKAAKSGVETNEKGVKGFSWCVVIPKFDIIRGIAIDYMHGTLLGVVKMLLTLWLNKKHSKQPWSLSRQVAELDSRYLKMTPPACITRLPRSLASNFGHLKASELRTFLLFYSIPCLYGLLPEIYFQHYILLVEAVYLLLQESISLNDVKKASALLKHFCLKIGELYGPRYETYNAHCLLHMTERVCDMGPLWTHSCFAFEDFNGELRNMFHGTQSVEEQLVMAVSIQQKIPLLTPLLTEGSIAKELFDKMNNKTQPCIQKESIGDGFYKVGTIKPSELSLEAKIAVEALIGPVLSKVHTFQRVMLHGNQVVHCKNYTLMSKRNNYTIQYSSDTILKSPTYGQVQYYVTCYTTCLNPTSCSDSCACKEPHHLAMVYPLRENKDIVLAMDQHTKAELSHLIPVVKDLPLKAININQMDKLCVYIECENLAFVGLFPNQCEKD